MDGAHRVLVGSFYDLIPVIEGFIRSRAVTRLRYHDPNKKKLDHYTSFADSAAKSNKLRTGGEPKRKRDGWVISLSIRKDALVPNRRPCKHGPLSSHNQQNKAVCRSGLTVRPLSALFLGRLSAPPHPPHYSFSHSLLVRFIPFFLPFLSQQGGR
jgi:hypothetical protein